MKQKGLKERAPAEVEQVSHLDQKLTEITTRTAEALKRWRHFFLAIVIVGVAAYGIYWITRISGESRKEYFNQEIYELFHSATARKQGYKLDKGRLDKLLQDVKGDPAEKMVLQDAIGWYLEYADRERKTQSIPGFEEPEGPITITEAEAREARAEAARLASEAAARNPDDTELGLWAASVKRKVEGEATRPWQKDRRKYMPPAIGGAPAGTPPSPGASSPGAGETSATPTASTPDGDAKASAPAQPPVHTGTAVNPGAAAPPPDQQTPAGAQPSSEKSEKATP